MVQELPSFIARHRVEIVIGVICAVVFGCIIAVIFEILDIGSRLRAGIRRIKNKSAEASAKQLRERIKQLETQRDNYAAYLSSDKALYLATFRIIIGILICMTLGAIFPVLNQFVRVPLIESFSIFFYGVAVVAAAQGLKISSLDTRQKVSEVVAKIESEILDMQKKLETIAK